MGTSLEAVFKKVLAEYPSARKDQTFGRGSAFWPCIDEVRVALASTPALEGRARTKIKVSFGQGGWAEVPNFAIMNTRETERPSAGIYVVYLLRADASGIVLSLNQGSADLILTARGRVYDVLRARAAKVREALQVAALAQAGFTDSPIDLASTGQYPRAYAAGSVVAKTYKADSVPSAEVLSADLALLLGAYESLIPSTKLRLPTGASPASAGAVERRRI